MQRAGGAGDVVGVRVGQVGGQRHQFAAVRCEHGTGVEQGRDRPGDRGRVEHARHPGRDGGAHGGRHGVVRDLGADEHAARAVEHARGQLPDPGVGPGADGDLVLPRRVDDDEGDAGGLTVQHGDGRGVDARGAQLGERGLPGRVVPHGADQHDLRPGAGRGHGGVGALAPARTPGAAADDGLAGPGQPRGDDGQVDVDGSGDHDATHGPTLGRCRPR